MLPVFDRSKLSTSGDVVTVTPRTAFGSYVFVFADVLVAVNGSGGITLFSRVLRTLRGDVEELTFGVGIRRESPWSPGGFKVSVLSAIGVILRVPPFRDERR